MPTALERALVASSQELINQPGFGIQGALLSSSNVGT